MSLGLNAALGRAFRALHEREVRAPWTHPDGAFELIRIRPHDDPEYQAALAAAGVVPRSAQERAAEAPELTDIQVLAGHKLSDEDAERAREIEARGAEIVRIGFPWRHYPVAYTLAEVAQVRELVLEHLVVGVRTVPGEGREAEAVVASPAEVAEWFGSVEPLPHCVAPGKAEDDTKREELAKALGPDKLAAALKIREPEPVPVYLGGVPQGVAVAAFVLRESVRADQFLERLGPLGRGSGSTPGAPGITASSPESRALSPPSSSPADIPAATPAVPARRSDGPADIAAPASAPTTTSAAA